MAVLVQSAIRDVGVRQSALDWAGLTEAMGAVEASMECACRGEGPDPLGVMVSTHLATGGKRLRARLALAGVSALGGDMWGAVPWAAACEMLHNATLIHDDLQDGDTTRRGQPALWVRHGPAQAINAGDLLLMLPFTLVGELDVPGKLRWRLTRSLAYHAAATARGQAMELMLLPNGALNWDSYLVAVAGKTSALFRLPVEGAAMLAGFRGAEAERIATVFQTLGLLFQLQDDVIDLYGDKGRGEVGSDLREGRVSALVVEHLARRPSERDRLLAVLRTPRDATGDEQVREVRERFDDADTLNGVLERIEDEAQAMASSVVLAAHPELRALALELCDLVLAPVRELARRRGDA